MLGISTCLNQNLEQPDSSENNMITISSPIPSFCFTIITCQFHDGVIACVLEDVEPYLDPSLLQAFSVANGVKQGCVLVPGFPSPGKPHQPSPGIEESSLINFLKVVVFIYTDGRGTGS